VVLILSLCSSRYYSSQHTDSLYTYSICSDHRVQTLSAVPYYYLLHMSSQREESIYTLYILSAAPSSSAAEVTTAAESRDHEQQQRSRQQRTTAAAERGVCKKEKGERRIIEKEIRNIIYSSRYLDGMCVVYTLSLSLLCVYSLSAIYSLYTVTQYIKKYHQWLQHSWHGITSFYSIKNYIDFNFFLWWIGRYSVFAL